MKTVHLIDMIYIYLILLSLNETQDFLYFMSVKLKLTQIPNLKNKSSFSVLSSYRELL